MFPKLNTKQNFRLPEFPNHRSTKSSTVLHTVSWHDLIKLKPCAHLAGQPSGLNSFDEEWERG
jgi:hypothetical protein